MSKLAKFKKKHRRSNPSDVDGEVKSTAISIGAGFAGYAATSLAARVAYAQSIKQFPKAANHIHVAASALGAAGVYFGSKHWSKVDEYHEAASIGAGIALLKTAMQTYLPKFGWVVSDVREDQYSGSKGKASALDLPSADLSSLLPTETELEASASELDDPEDSFDLDALLASDSDLEAVPLGLASEAEAWH